MNLDIETHRKLEDLCKKYELNYTLFIHAPAPGYIGIDAKDLIGLLECMDKLLEALENI